MRGAAAHAFHQRVEPRAVRGVVELELGDLAALVGSQRLEPLVGDLLAELVGRVEREQLAAGRDRGDERRAVERVVVAPAIAPAGA
jgi:hypothetical protein